MADDDKLLVPVVPRQTSLDIETVDKIAENLKASKSEATKKAYGADWGHFMGFCASYGFTSMPATPEVLAAYLSNMADSYAWATIARRLSTISQAHKLKGEENPAEHPLVREVCQGIRRRLGVSGRQVKPILPVDLARWLPLLPEGDFRTVRDAALLTMGLAGGFRRSELATLALSDVERHEQGLLVTVRRSKGDQEGEGLIKGLAWGRSEVTCPVRRWEAWQDAVGSRYVRQSEDPAFLSINRGGGITDRPIHGQTVARAIKRLVALSGENPDEYSGHSLRSGFITAAVQAGARADRIMAQTGHKSYEVMARYIRQASVWEENPSGMIGL